MGEQCKEYIEIDLFDLLERTKHKNKIELSDMLDCLNINNEENENE